MLEDCNAVATTASAHFAVLVPPYNATMVRVHKGPKYDYYGAGASWPTIAGYTTGICSRAT